MKSFGTRLDEETGSDLLAAAQYTGLRPADILRIGARMVIKSIKANKGLRLGENPTPKKRRPAK